ncbi:MAG TPA: hypothetical protein VHW43_11420 [Puia sp.]|jgi:hypothetical protein|nr:hypothetical protein [Puia sp.]
MKRLPLCFALSFLLLACHRKIKQQDTQDTKELLENAMARFLDGSQATKAEKLRYDVQDVTYYEEPTIYICEFKIKLTLPDGRDTVGMMKERVDKNSMTIQR